MKSLVVVLVALAAGVTGCVGTSTLPSGVSKAALALPSMTWAFGNVTTVDSGALGVSEPSILVDPTGAIWISGPTGLVTPLVDHNPQPYTHDTSMFKSTDGGKTWTNMEDIPGYGRDVCPGGGDSALAASPDKSVYLADLNLENVPVDVTTNGGQTWTFNCHTSIVPGLDRQWIAATDKYVWVVVDQLTTGPELYRADKLGLPVDGLVFGPPKSVPESGPIVVDQVTGTLYLAGSGKNVLVSTDNGATFTAHPTGLANHSLNGSFISIALDAKGDVFVAGAGKDGLVVSASADHGATWTPGVVFAPYGASAALHTQYAFAWVAAGGNGTMDMAWYGQPPHAGNDTQYFVYAIQKTNFLADPTNASYAFTQVTPKPIATKPLCIGINLAPPTPCDADGKHTRALGDFFETAVDAQGNFVMAFDDGNGHSPPWLDFAKETAGALAPAGAANLGSQGSPQGPLPFVPGSAAGLLPSS
ncbi:MAG: WD40/YVTN/BNR-like repeat-containing protein [Thermoplasmatota archaeon]